MRGSSSSYVFPFAKVAQPRSTLTPAVLVLCGSFSPITFMHLRLLEQCRDYCHSERRFEVLGGFITPVGDAYGKKGLETASHRVKMCQLAVADSSWISVDTWESEQLEYQHTLYVLRHFKAEIDRAFPDKNVRVLIACGADLLMSFQKPGVWADDHVESILSDFGIVCLERDSTDIRSVLFESERLYRHRQNILFVPQYMTNATSSTIVRKLVMRHLSITYLVPKAVEDYIHNNKLYLDSSIESKVSIFGNY